MANISGRCYCGSVQLSLNPSHVISQNYCHCKNCAYKHGSPFVNVVVSSSIQDAEKGLISPVTVTKGSEFVKIAKKPLEDCTVDRVFCSECGTPLWNNVRGGALMITFPSLYEGWKFEPTIHINYENAVVKMNDGLTKFKDFPREAGGSGVLINE